MAPIKNDNELKKAQEVIQQDKIDREDNFMKDLEILKAKYNVILGIEVIHEVGEDHIIIKSKKLTVTAQ